MRSLRLRKHLVLTDRKGSPLAVLRSAANVQDTKCALPLVDAIPLVHHGRRGRPRQRPKKAHGDKGYDVKGE